MKNRRRPPLTHLHPKVQDLPQCGIHGDVYIPTTHGIHPIQQLLLLNRGRLCEGRQEAGDKRKKGRVSVQRRETCSPPRCPRTKRRGRQPMACVLITLFNRLYPKERHTTRRLGGGVWRRAHWHLAWLSHHFDSFGAAHSHSLWGLWVVRGAVCLWALLLGQVR
jgi:hypothetical protein